MRKEDFWPFPAIPALALLIFAAAFGLDVYYDRTGKYEPPVSPLEDCRLPGCMVVMFEVEADAGVLRAACALRDEGPVVCEPLLDRRPARFTTEL